MKTIYFLMCLSVLLVSCSSDDNEGTDPDEGNENEKADFELKAAGHYVDSVTISWEKLEKTDEYEIRYADNEEMKNPNTFSTTDTSASIENLEKGRSYFFEVRAKSESGWTDWSTTSEFKTASFQAAVTTYNVLGKEYDYRIEEEYAWDLRKEALKNMILQEDNNPDIIGFQETYESGPELKEMIAGTYDAYLTEKKISPRLIAWKPDKFELVETGDIDVFENQVSGYDKSRYAIYVRLREIETDREVLVYNLHFPAGSEEDKQEARKIGAENLSALIKRETKDHGLPTIVLGDFNNYMETEIGGFLSGPKVFSENEFMDSFEGTSNRKNIDYSTTINRATSSTKPGENGEKRIDFIFTYPTDKIAVSDYSILINFQQGSTNRLEKPVPSDHHPVRSVLHFTY